MKESRPMTGGVVTGAVVLWIVPIFVARAQGRSKNRTGWLYGFFLGWIGVLILALLGPLADPSYGECPYCRESVRFDASVCPHCRRELTPT